MTLHGLGPVRPVWLPVAQRFPLATLRGLGTPLPPLVVGDDLDRTAPIPLVRPIFAVAVRRRLPAVVPQGGRVPPPECSRDAVEDRRQQARMRKVRRFGYRAIAAVALLSVAELVYLLVA